MTNETANYVAPPKGLLKFEGVKREDERIVSLKDMICSSEFENQNCAFVFGEDAEENKIIGNLSDLGNLLIAGIVGIGKSIFLDSFITSLMYTSSPEDVKFILIGSRSIDFVVYRRMPHLLTSVILDDEQILNTLNWTINEIERRNALFKENEVDSIEQYNDRKNVIFGAEKKLQHIIVIVDDFGEIMERNDPIDFENKIFKIASKTNKTGVHLIMSTNRLRNNVLTEAIKSRFPNKIVFCMDDKKLFDEVRMPTPYGCGNMQYVTQFGQNIQCIQVPFVTFDEIDEVVQFLRANNQSDYDDSIKDFFIEWE